MAGIKLQSVTKRFRDVVAVHEVDLQVADGEFLVLVGPSGCGKSTTLRMVAGLETVTEGEIYIGERVVNDVQPKDRDVAMVFQNYALYPHMNVYNNMGFGLKLRRYGRGEIERRVRAAAELLGIGELLHRRPRELSGGQRQRVALGRALVREPAVYLMDEPLSNLDAKLRVQMRAEISKLHQRVRTTTVYVTHDQIEAMTMGDRIAVLKDGIVQQVASPNGLYRQPANVFVAGFIGSPPMNLVPLSYRRVDGAPRLVGEGLELALPPAYAERLERARERRVVMGVRPEHIVLGAPGAEPEALPAQVEVVEPLGAETYVHLRVDGQTLIARAPGDTSVREGERVGAHLEPAHLRVFDAATGEAL